MHSWDKCKSLYVVDTVVVLLSGEKNIVINNTRMKTGQGQYKYNAPQEGKMQFGTILSSPFSHYQHH